MTKEFHTLEHVAVPVFVLDVTDEGEPVYVAFNRVAREIAGLKLSDILHRTATEIYGEDLGIVALSHHMAVIESGVPETYELELPLNGVVRYVRTTLQPILNEDGEVIRLVGTSQDISSEKRALEAQVSLETMSRELEQFVGMAAHDLRTPMNNIVALADMLREDFVDHGDGKLELIQKVEDVACKSLALIADVLDHVQTTGAKAERTQFPLAALCSDLADVLDPKHLHNYRFAEEEIIADRTALQIVLRNLIDNALKHGRSERLTVTVDVSAAEDGMLLLSVADNGQGLDDPARLFQSNSKKRSQSGFGLLGISRLIRARGGRITARNRRRGQGMVVQFTLPGVLIDIPDAIEEGTAASLPRSAGLHS